MTTINPAVSNGLIALKVLKPQNKESPETEAQPVLGQSEPFVTPSLWSAVMSSAWVQLTEPANAVPLSDLPSGHADSLRKFGIDSAVRRERPVVSDEEFQNIVMSHLKDSWMGLEGFSEALANGTVKIQRAEDVEGLGYETILYDMYRGGYHIGAAGWGEGINREFYDAQAAQGVRQGVGSINGLDFYVTW